jgi:hypothetical protein
LATVAMHSARLPSASRRAAVEAGIHRSSIFGTREQGGEIRPRPFLGPLRRLGRRAGDRAARRSTAARSALRRLAVGATHCTRPAARSGRRRRWHAPCCRADRTQRR